MHLKYQIISNISLSKFYNYKRHTQIAMEIKKQIKKDTTWFLIVC